MDRKSAHTILQQSGFNPQFVAAGMEGFVFDIGNTLLAKVWIKKGYREVEQLGSFYSQLQEKQLPFATPRICEVLQRQDGSVISLEKRLPGISLKQILEHTSHSATLFQQGIDVTFSVTTALQTVGDLSVARNLPLLNQYSLWTPAATWNTVLCGLVTLRVNKYKTQLQRSVPDLERKVSRVVALLEKLNITRPGVIHGDICPENILVDKDTLTPTALIDFGFLTTSADPLFDAVTSTLFFDMYSPRALEAREKLHYKYAQNLGEPFSTAYPLYKAAYALVTSNAYSENGEDGHFRWCVDILNDQETNAFVS